MKIKHRILLHLGENIDSALCPSQILLDELPGLDEGLIGPLRDLYLKPLSSLLFPDCGGKWLDSHKVFAVKYTLDEDLELSYHYDNAEVTLNVSLGKDFTDGNLYFGDMRQVNQKKKKRKHQR